MKAHGPTPCGRSWAGTSAALAIAALAGLGACTGGPPAAIADRVDVRVEVMPDGSLLVDEVTEVRLTPDTPVVERDVDPSHLDALVWESAAFDGQSIGPDGGTSGVRFAVDDGRGLTARWTVDDIQTATHTFSLTYRVRGAVRISGRRGSLVRPFLPGNLRVGDARVELVLPDGVAALRGTGIAEAGWVVEATPRGIVATRSGVGDATGTLLADFPIDVGVVVVPDWQVTEDLRTQFAPAFVSGALFFIVIGIGVLWIIRFQRTSRRGMPADVAEARVAELPPTLAVRVARGPSGSGDALLAGAVRALDREGRQREAAAPRWRHERVLADWLTESPVREPSALRRRQPEFERALAADLHEAGLVDADRITVRSGLATTAWVTVAFAVVCAGIAAAALGRFGWWAQLIPGSMLVVALMFGVASRRLSVGSWLGDRAAAYWRQRLDALADPSPSIDDASGLAWALAAGAGPSWMRRHADALRPEVRGLVSEWLGIAAAAASRRAQPQ